jgi:hypothetical protein
MRATLTLISLLTLTSTTAFAQWDVRPAPPSWGVPQYSAPVARQNDRETNRNETRVQSSAPTNTTFNEAVGCSAALQLATMAAPSWAQEKGITDITNAWLQKVFALGEQQGVTGDKVPNLVETEMQRQIESAASDPANLSRRAFDCASRQP